jgi:PKD repeat protein
LRIFKSKRTSIPKIAVLATGLAAAVLVATINPMPAQATPRASSCAGCHNPATAGVTTATPSTATPTPGASYTVAITLVANPLGGNTGYGIVPIAPAVEKTFGGNTGSQLAFTATMVAPAAAGTYSYTVWTDQGPTDGSAQVGNAVYSITVAAAPVQVTTTTALTMAPTAATAVAPAAKTLTAAVTGAGAAGTVQFFNGTASLGSSPVASGSATLALSNIGVGSYSYHAVFTPTNAALFTSSTSSNVAFTVTAAPPVQVTTTTALSMAPTAATAVAPAAKTLTAAVSGAGAAGTVQFFNGTTSLGTSPVASGSAALALSNIGVGSYSYHAVFTPTTPALFTSSTSGNLAFTVTAAPPVVIAPVANFTAAVSGLSAAMTDTSTNAPTSWSWDLGNGTSSTLQNPPVTYAAAGIYEVTLTATNSAGSNSVTKSVTVSDSTPLPSAAFIRHLSNDEGRVGDKVTIDGTGFGAPGVVQFGTATAKVVSWTATKIVVIVPAINGVVVDTDSEDWTPVWYRHDQEVDVTVTPAGAAASNGVEFELKSSRHHDGDDD